jgi:hypothetical protein
MFNFEPQGNLQKIEKSSNYGNHEKVNYFKTKVREAFK